MAAAEAAEAAAEAAAAEAAAEACRPEPEPAAEQAGGGAAQAAPSGSAGRPPAVQLPPGTYTCEASDYCSVGKVKTWRGDVASTAALKELLSAVAYKNELVLTMLSGSGHWAQMALNLVRSAEELGG